MKKYVMKATALAIGALVGGGAFAAIVGTGPNFVTDTATTIKFATELNYSATGPAAITGAEVTFTSKLGFGVSSGQNRYIRVDYSGARFAANATGALVTGLSQTGVGGVVTGAQVTVVAGGSGAAGSGDSYVIYQITGGSSGEAASTALTVAAPDLYTTAGNSGINVTYALYETAVAAANATAGTSLYSVSGELAKFASGVTITATPYTNTALVAKDFKQYQANGAAPVALVDTIEVGNVAIAATTGVRIADGNQAALNNIYGAATKIKFGGQFANLGAGGIVYVDAAGCPSGNAPLAPIQLTPAADKLSATYTFGAAAGNKSLCLVTDGTLAQVEQTFTYDVNPAAAAASVTPVDPGALTIGKVVRDGTTLQAPFATIHPDYLSRVVLTSQASTDVAFKASVIAEDGAACSAAPYSGSLKAGKMLVLNVKDICPSLTTSGTRMAVQVVLDTPLNTVHGLYNVMNYDQTTGKTNSLISYPMVRPTEN